MIGRADGALAGYFPQPALGLVPAAGIGWRDDFQGDTLSRWSLVQTGAGELSRPIAPVAAGESGVWELFATNNPESNRITNSLTIPYLYLDGSAATWPAGLIYCAKIKRSLTTSNQVWSGFMLDNTSLPSAAGAQGITIHQQSSSSTMVGRVTNAAGSETVTLTTSSTDHTSFRAWGFEFVMLPGDVPGVQFFRLDLSDRRVVQRTDISSPLTTRIPTTSLYLHALGQHSITTADRTAQIDFMALGGRTRR
jgi:hypothetical protein